jgi:hypothetical protein
MEHEDEPILREATDQADHAAREGDGSGERNAPVGEARRHKRPSLFISVNPYISGLGSKSSSPSIKIYHNYVTKMTRKSASRISPTHHAYCSETNHTLLPFDFLFSYFSSLFLFV